MSNERSRRGKLRRFASEEHLTAVIRLLASIFRGLSYIVGMTAPPPGEKEKQFVLLWLGIFAIVIIAVPAIFYVVLKLTVR